MATLTIETFKGELDKYYQGITSDISAREYAEKCYAIIGIKQNNKELERYGQPLYLDVKHFITQHLDSFDTEDYGYDIPNNDKLLKAICSLPAKEQLAMCRYASGLYENRGYETSFLDKRINCLRMKIAASEHHYVSFLLRLSAHNIWTLLGSYLVFLVIVYVVLLPAPCEWMGILEIEPHNFGLGSFKNQLMNVLALVMDGDYAPEITPCGLRGMALVIFGKVLFYLLIGNFVVKKLSDFFSFE